MTFDEARKKALDRLDAAYAKLYALAKDPAWCNDLCREYKEVTAEMTGVLADLRRLNEVALVAGR
jgi:hypothetical protein